MKALAIAQIVVGVLILFIDALAVGAVFSKHFDKYYEAERLLMEIPPAALPASRALTMAIIPLSLVVIGLGIAQLRKSQKQ